MEAVVTPDGSWTDRSVLVTGATGLLGGWVTQALVERGAAVVCLVRDSVPDARVWREGLGDKVIAVDGDVVDQATIERVLGEREVRTVFHLAAQAIVPIAGRNAVSTFDTNIRGTWSVLEACRRSPLVSEVVVASSDKAYGDQPVLPYREDMPLLARHPYDVSKACADLLSATYADTWDVPVVVTRCGNFFGPGDLNFNRLVPGVMRDVLLGRRPLIRSDGSLVRDYLYAHDGALAYLHLAEALMGDRSLIGRAFNFSLEEPQSVLELVARIQAVAGTDLEPDIRGEASGEILAQYLDSSAARRELGWAPTVGLDEGLRRTLDWYRTHLGLD